MTRFIGIAAAAGALFAIGLVGAGGAAANTVCTWAGTPAEPTGTFSITPGVTDIPSPGPLRFKATGKVSGGGRCRGTMTFDGQMDAGATCPWSDFDGRVKGMPGVARFHGKGSLLVPSILYDANGNVVGEENAQIVTQSSFAHATACTTPQGFTGGWPGMFSSVFELFD